MSSAPSRPFRRLRPSCAKIDVERPAVSGRRKRRLYQRALVLACMPLALAMRLLRPILWIRLGWLQTHKIGHLPLEAEFYLCERKAGIQPAGTLDLFYDRERGDGRVCNAQAMAMVERHLHVWRFAKYLWKANKRLPGADAHI